MVRTYPVRDNRLLACYILRCGSLSVFRLRTGLVANLVRRENLGTRLGLTIARNVTISGAVPTGQAPGEGGLPYISHKGRYVQP